MNDLSDFICLCDQIDASCFSGDSLYDEKNLQDFKYYVERWNRKIKEIEDYNLEVLKERISKAMEIPDGYLVKDEK